MLSIPLKEGDNIERSLKKYKRKFEKTKVLRQLRARQAFIKPSVMNRKKVKKAVYVEQLIRNLEEGE
jgi:small subunit ribosomal protein S21